MYETHIDDEALATGTHEGADGASVLYAKKHFRSCGVSVGLAIHNDTQVTDGLVTAVTEYTVADDTNSWNYGDTYSIYKTSEKDTFLSRIKVDKSRGWKVTKEEELNANGWFPEDHDLDVDEDGFDIDPPPFGPNQPSRSHNG